MVSLNYSINGSTVVVSNMSTLSLRDTLCCGQSFRWREREDGSFFGVAMGKALCVKKVGDELFLIGTNEDDFNNIWSEYFDLSLDYKAVRESLSALHPTLCTAARFAPGIHILRQEPFEALISFIISQNNNIKRIEGIVDRLCESFGDEISEGVYSFPTAEVLSKLSVDELSPIRAGFRHRYIIDAARKVADGEVDLEALRDMPYEDARKKLMTITGVGEKVADCTLLYGLHRTEAFPLDVWMKRAMKVLFDGVDPSYFGEYAGIAQQYIFHYSRMHPELFE